MRNIIKTLLILLFCMVATVLTGVYAGAKSASARPPSYALQEPPARGYWSILRIYNRKTGRTVWRRKCYGAYSSSWSADHRAFAIAIGNLKGYPNYYNGQFRLLYWRAGESVRLVRHPELFKDFDEIGTDITWSPDNRRFAFRAGGMATPYGTLCCVDAKTGRFFFGPASVETYHWLGARRLRYIVMEIQPSHKFNPDGTFGYWVRRRPRYWSGSVTSPEWSSAWADPTWR